MTQHRQQEKTRKEEQKEQEEESKKNDIAVRIVANLRAHLDKNTGTTMALFHKMWPIAVLVNIVAVAAAVVAVATFIIVAVDWMNEFVLDSWTIQSWL